MYFFVKHHFESQGQAEKPENASEIRIRVVFSDMGSGTTFEFEFTQGELIGHNKEEGGDSAMARHDSLKFM